MLSELCAFGLPVVLISEGSLACFGESSIVVLLSLQIDIHPILLDTSGCLVVISLQMGNFCEVMNGAELAVGPASYNSRLVETSFESCGVAERGEKKEFNQYKSSANGELSSGHQNRVQLAVAFDSWKLWNRTSSDTCRVAR
jgi:hypothetical protein